MPRRLACGIAVVFLVRGVAYLPSDLRAGLEDSYQRLDPMIYSPICLSLAAGTAILLRRTGIGPDAKTSRAPSAGPSHHARPVEAEA